MIVELRRYKEVSYLYTDYSGANSEKEMFALFNKGQELLNSNPDVKNVLNNYTGVIISPGYANMIKEKGKSPHVVKVAIVGVTGMEKFVSNTINMSAKFQAVIFPDEKEALEWLVL